MFCHRVAKWAIMDWMNRNHQEYGKYMLLMDEDSVCIFMYILFVRKGNTILQWAYELNSISHSR
jgi:hypothetical protein